MNIIIGVGGTGSKLVEAVIHMATAGIGPTQLQVGFVDQDESNGNLNRTATVFKAYRKARAAWRHDGATHCIVGSKDCPVLKTDIQPLGGGDGLWIPDERAGATLKTLFGPMNEDQFLFDALYETGDNPETEEQNLDLGDGYRGRPHIGAAAMTLKAQERGPFWDAITEAIKGAGQGTVRILLAGSVFGGTGAAGFPTIARLIRDRLAEEEITRNVDIGGILMLPYFGFPDPDQDQDQNVARAHEQEIQASGALRHYQHLLGDRREGTGQHIFDQLYLIGWHPYFTLDVHSKGSGSQRNPALLPEFLAATAAARFFSADQLPQEEVTQNITVSARSEHRGFVWSDLPPISPASDNREVLQQDIARFLRFCAAFKYWIPQINDEGKRRSVAKQKWFPKQGLNEINWHDDSPSDALDHMEAIIDHALVWFAMIDTYSRRHDRDFGLWRVGKPLVEEISFERTKEEPGVAAALSEGDYERVFETIATQYASDKASMPDASYLLDRLTHQLTEGEDHKGMGEFIAALYSFSDIRPDTKI